MCNVNTCPFTWTAPSGQQRLLIVSLPLLFMQDAFWCLLSLLEGEKYLFGFYSQSLVRLEFPDLLCSKIMVICMYIVMYINRVKLSADIFFMMLQQRHCQLANHMVSGLCCCGGGGGGGGGGGCFVVSGILHMWHTDVSIIFVCACNGSGFFFF